MLENNYNKVHYRDTAEIRGLIEMMWPEFRMGDEELPYEPIYDKMERDYANTLPHSSDAEGIEKWERLLWIVSNPKESLGVRVDRVLRTILPRDPITEPWLHQKLQELTSGEITAMVEDLVLYLNVTSISSKMVRDIIAWLQNIIPCNIMMNVVATIEQEENLYVLGAMFQDKTYTSQISVDLAMEQIQASSSEVHALGGVAFSKTFTSTAQIS